MRRISMALILAVANACQRSDRPQTADTTMPGMTLEEPVRSAPAEPASAAAAVVASDTVRLSSSQAAAIGVTYTSVERGPLVRTVRTLGRIVAAEPRIAEVTSKIEGFADTVFAAATGATVRKGDPLIALYSPMLVSAQEELITALRLAGTVSADPDARRNADALVAAARRRLTNWDISADQITRLEQAGQVTRTLTMTSPVSGVILEKMIVAGQAVMPGMTLYRLGDLSEVWIEGEVYEQDLATVRVGSVVLAAISAYPDRTFRGRVQLVWPVVEPESRTGRIRVAVANRSGDLKPGMYATLSVDARLAGDALSLPLGAVVRTGERNVVFVVRADGSLESRNVVLGAEAGDRVQVVSGVTAGERVVASGNFLVDAESRLGTGAMTGMPGMPGMPDRPATPADSPETRDPAHEHRP